MPLQAVADGSVNERKGNRDQQHDGDGDAEPERDVRNQGYDVSCSGIQRIAVISPLFLSATFDHLQRDLFLGSSPLGDPDAAMVELDVRGGPDHPPCHVRARDPV